MSNFDADSTAPWCRECGPTCPLHGTRNDVLKALLADAWDAGWDERDGYCSEPYSPDRDNPYRTTHQLDATEQRENR